MFHCLVEGSWRGFRLKGSFRLRSPPSLSLFTTAVLHCPSTHPDSLVVRAIREHVGNPGWCGGRTSDYHTANPNGRGFEPWCLYELSVCNAWSIDITNRMNATTKAVSRYVIGVNILGEDGNPKILALFNPNPSIKKKKAGAIQLWREY